MRLRLNDLLCAAGAGAICGLGLARLLAEAGFWSLLYVSPLAVAGVAIVCAAIALALFEWKRQLVGVLGPPKQAFAELSRGVSASIPPHFFYVIPLTPPLLYVTGIVSSPLAGCVLLVGGAALALLLAWGDRARWLPPAVLGLATFALYLRTLLPSVGVADTFEFQVVVPLLRVAHPTGYPLYVLLGKLFTLLPLGNVAWRVNLASAVFATGAVLVLYAIILRLTGGWLPAFLAALAFAFSFTFWSQAIVAEVYTLHNLLVAVILWLLLGQSEARRWQAVFFLVGLSLTNHLTTALLLPAVGLALLWDRPRLRLKDWLIAGGLLLLGLSVYLFIPLRWPALNQGEWMGPRDFFVYISGGQFHGALRLDGWRDPVRWGIVGRLLREPFGWIGLGLAAVGVVRLAAHHRRALALTGVTFLAFVLYGLDYYVPDISVFLLPAHLILAIWIGAGIAFLVALPSQLCHRSCVIGHCSLVIASLVIASLFIVHCLSRIWLNFPLVDQSHNRGGYAWGQYVLSLPLASDSAVLADPGKFAPLYYLQQIEGVRPDLDLILLGSEELYQAELTARLGVGQTVYLARYLPHLEGLHLRSVGPLVEVGVESFEHPSPDFGRGDGGEGGDEAGVRFGETIRLLDAEASADSLGRALYHLTLYWRAETRVSGDFVVRLRLVDAEGQVRWESEGARPVGGLYPTNAWPVGAVVSDYHEVSFPPHLPPGEYELEVGLFPPFSDVGLKRCPEPFDYAQDKPVEGVSDGATVWLALETLEVPPPSEPLPPLPYERRYCFASGAWLTGYNLAGEAAAGASFVADLSWRGVETGAVVRLAWVAADGREVGAAPTNPLAAGTLCSRHVITAPQSPGDYTLRVGLVGETAHCGWLAPPAGGCPLATVKVTPAQEEWANFGDVVLLLDAQVGRDDAQPGEIVPVALQWRALRAMDEDYTVFVHLVGPDGRLHGQVDMWPVQGSYPTSQWTPGEQVSDFYEARLAPDAPPGHYRVEVGWYLVATMHRLPIVNVEGQPVGDSLVVGEFDVGD